MTQQKVYRVVAIIFYLFIILNGQMIAVPFFFWLFFTLVIFGDIDQLFAFLAVASLVTIFRNHNKIRTSKILSVDLLCFFLLLSPLIRRVTAVPIQLFNYSAFIVPTTLFVLFYTVSLLLGCKQHSQIMANSN